MAKSRLVKANQKIAEAVVGSYQKLEDGVTGAYQKLERSFVDQFLTREGESVEDAQQRLREEQAKRWADAQKAAEKRAAEAAARHSGRR